MKFHFVINLVIKSCMNEPDRETLYWNRAALLVGKSLKMIELKNVNFFSILHPNFIPRTLIIQ